MSSVRLQASVLVALFATLPATLLSQAPGPPPPSPPRHGPGPFPNGPAPPPPGGPGPPGGVSGVRHRLAEVHSTGAETDRMLALARTYLERSDRTAASHPFASNRIAGVADALVHAAEHQNHLKEKTGPEPPQRDEIARHLEHLYFRLQQADYFVDESSDANAKSIAGWARQYYQSALRASDREDRRAADENAKSADDLMHALENLAQAAAPVGAPPKPPGPIG